MGVENAVEAARFVDIAVDAVLDFGRGVAVEMVGLALHGAETWLLFSL